MTCLNSSPKFKSFKEYKDKYYPEKKEIKIEEIQDPKILGRKLAELSMEKAMKDLSNDN